MPITLVTAIACPVGDPLVLVTVKRRQGFAQLRGEALFVRVRHSGDPRGIQVRPHDLAVPDETSIGRFTTMPASPTFSPPGADTSSFTTSRVEARVRVQPATAPVSSDSMAPSRTLEPYSASAAATLGRIDSGAAPPPPWRWLPPTQTQRDSAGRVEAQPAAEARSDHRPMPIALGSIPLRMPFGGAVRSPERRAKTASSTRIICGFARLAQRVRAKCESTLAARSIAHRDRATTGTPKP